MDNRSRVIAFALGTTLVTGPVVLIVSFIFVREVYRDVVFSGPPTEAPMREKVVPFAGELSSEAKDIRLQFGFVNRDGQLAIKPRFDDASGFHEQRAAVRSDDAWSFIDTSGRTLPSEKTPVRFSRVHDFSEGLAAARDGRKWGFVDRNCHWTIEPKWRSVSDFHDGWAVVSETGDNGMLGVIDRSGKVLLEPCRCEIDTENTALRRIRVDDLYGFLDHGKVSIAPKYRDARPFAESVAAVMTDNNKWGFIDPSGKQVIESSFASCGSFRNELASAAEKGNFGLIDHSGVFVVKPQYEFLSAVFIPKSYSNSCSSEGLTPIAIDGKWGFANRLGKVTIEPRFLDVGIFSEGLAVAGTPVKPKSADPKKNDAVESRQAPLDEAEVHIVVYAKRDIKVGEVIQEEDLEERESKDCPPEAFQSIYEVEGQTAIKAVSAGKLVSRASIEDTNLDQWSFDSKIAVGTRAVTLSLACTKVSPTLRPGNKVNLLSLVESSQHQFVFEPLVSNAPIVALDQYYTEGSTLTDVSRITIAVDGRSTGKLLKSVISGNIYVALGGPSPVPRAHKGREGSH